jgi:uncharacterized protein (DUF433 family)
MESKLKRIAIDPKVLGGKPVIKGTRIAVYLILELLSSGMTEQELLKQYPGLRRGDVQAALEYASKILREEEVIPNASR